MKKKAAPVLAKKPAKAPDIVATSVPIIPRTTKRRRTRADIGRDLSEAYRVVFNSVFGEKVKADIFTYCNVYHEIDGKDLYEIGKRQGERNVALRIAKMLGLRPEHFDTDAWDTAGAIDNMMMA